MIPWKANYVLASPNRDGHMRVPGEVVHTIEAAEIPMLHVIETDPEWRGQPIYHGPGSAFHYAGLASSHGLAGNI